MNNCNYKKKKSLIVFAVITVFSFFVLLFAFGLIPLSNINNKQSFDIYTEVEVLNKEGNRTFSVEDSDWYVFLGAYVESTFFEEQNSWIDFTESLKSNHSTGNILHLDETNRVIWYGIFPVTYFVYYDWGQNLTQHTCLKYFYRTYVVEVK